MPDVLEKFTGKIVAFPEIWVYALDISMVWGVRPHRAHTVKMRDPGEPSKVGCLSVRPFPPIWGRQFGAFLQRTRKTGGPDIYRILHGI